MAEAPRAGSDYSDHVTGRVIIAAIVAANAGLMFGIDSGVMSGLTTFPPFKKKFFPTLYEQSVTGNETTPYCSYKDNTLQAMVSCVYLVGMVGALLSAVITRRAGKQRVLLCGATSYMTGQALMSGASNLGCIFAGRALIGMGLGLSNSAAPQILAEVSPARHRGKFGSMFQLACTIGIVVFSIINYGVRNVEKGWRITPGIAIAPPLLMILGSLTIPDSPNSLVDRGQTEKAREVLEAYRGTKNVDEEFNDIVDSVTEASKVTLAQSFRSMFTPRYAPALIIGISTQLFQQFSGINAIMYYSANLFNSIGKGMTESLRNTVIVNSVNCGSTFVAIALIDRLGRRVLLLEGAMQMVIMHVIIACVMGTKFSNTPGLIVGDQVGNAVLAMLCLFVAGFAWSWGPLPWAIPPEVNTMETRPAAIAISTLSNMLFTFIITMSFQQMLCSMQYGVFIFFAAFCILAFIFTLFLLPETKGVPVERVQILMARHPVWKGVMGDAAQLVEDRETAREARHVADAVEASKAKGLQSADVSEEERSE